MPCNNLERQDEEEVGRRFLVGADICIWGPGGLIHGDVWQKATQCCNYSPIKNKNKIFKKGYRFIKQAGWETCLPTSSELGSLGNQRVFERAKGGHPCQAPRQGPGLMLVLGNETASEGAGVEVVRFLFLQDRAALAAEEGGIERLRPLTWHKLALPCKSPNSLMDKCSSKPHLYMTPHSFKKQILGYLKVWFGLLWSCLFGPANSIRLAHPARFINGKCCGLHWVTTINSWNNGARWKVAL